MSDLFRSAMRLRPKIKTKKKKKKKKKKIPIFLCAPLAELVAGQWQHSTRPYAKYFRKGRAIRKAYFVRHAIIHYALKRFLLQHRLQ